MGLSIPDCSGIKKDGKPCQYRGRYDGFCKFHEPKDLPTCSICYEDITKRTSIVTGCKHEFHRSCLQRWTAENSTCPMCRENIHPTTGVSRPPPAAIYILGRVPGGLSLSMFITENPPTPITYIDSHEELMPYLNALVDIRFTANYWDTTTTTTR